MSDLVFQGEKSMSARADENENRNLARVLVRIGIDDPDHPALADRVSLGRYLINLPFPKLRAEGLGVEEWREQRKVISHTEVKKLRRILRDWRLEEANDPGEPGEALTPGPPLEEQAGGGGVPLGGRAFHSEDPSLPGSPSVPKSPDPTLRVLRTPTNTKAFDKVSEEAGGADALSFGGDTAPEELLATVRANAPPPLAPVVEKMEGLAREGRYVEAFRVGVDAFDKQCEEPYVDSCLCVSMMSSRWDRDAHIAPYSLLDGFEALGAAFGKHVREMRHIDSDPLVATSGLYRMATKIYFSWIDHCAAILEHQHRRTNQQWIQVEWVATHKFNSLLSVMRSAVRIKLPLDLLFRIYQRLRQVVAIGKEAIVADIRKIKFEGDCLRVLASPSKDLIPDLCYLIYRDIIDNYVMAGENASALMFCDQALLLRRGDHEVEAIKAAVIAKSGRQTGASNPQRAGRSRARME